jgi:hypothetical protein
MFRFKLSSNLATSEWVIPGRSPTYSQCLSPPVPVFPPTHTESACAPETSREFCTFPFAAVQAQPTSESPSHRPHSMFYLRTQHAPQQHAPCCMLGAHPCEMLAHETLLHPRPAQTRAETHQHFALAPFQSTHSGGTRCGAHGVPLKP